MDTGIVTDSHYTFLHKTLLILNGEYPLRGCKGGYGSL